MKMYQFKSLWIMMTSWPASTKCSVFVCGSSGVELTANSLMERLDNGVLLCQLAQLLQEKMIHTSNGKVQQQHQVMHTFTHTDMCVPAHVLYSSCVCLCMCAENNHSPSWEEWSTGEPMQLLGHFSPETTRPTSSTGVERSALMRLTCLNQRIWVS